jgi:hypothetical protein
VYVIRDIIILKGGFYEFTSYLGASKRLAVVYRRSDIDHINPCLDNDTDQPGGFAPRDVAVF